MEPFMIPAGLMSAGVLLSLFGAPLKHHLTLTLALLQASLFSMLALGYVNWLGVILVESMVALALSFQWNRTRFYGVRLFALGLTVVAIASHQIPWFSAPLIREGLIWKSGSAAHDLYLSFHKGVAGLALILTCISCVEVKSSVKRERSLSFLMAALIASGMMFGLAVSLGFVQWAPGLEVGVIFLGLWAWNNLFITAFTEEVLFRGVLQTYLNQRLPGMRGSWLSIGITSVVFASLHFAGGVEFIVLSFVASLAYGAIYAATGRLAYAIALHFLINAIHLSFFTYPYAV